MIRTSIVVATTANDNYFQGLCVTVLSAIAATDPEFPLTFRIFDTGISKRNKQLILTLCGELRSGTKVNFLPISGNQFTGLSTDYGGGYSTYARLLMGSLIPEPRVIYIDSDFLVMRDLSEVWAQDFGENLMLATKDYDTPDGEANRLAADCPFAPAEDVFGYNYFNCGFLMVDLESWRAHQVERSALAQIKGYETRLKAWDQTILNYVLRGKIGEIDPNWCWSCSMAKVPADCNIHYISRMKPWNGWSMIPAYQLWYLFHSIFVAEDLPLKIQFKVKFRGLFRYLRDYSFLKIHILGDLYVRGIARRRGKTSAALYSAHLQKSRQAVREPDWKSTTLIQECKAKWLRQKSSTI